MSKQAVVAGATGLVGREVVRELLEDRDYERVIALVRRKLLFQHERLEQVVTDYEQLEAIRPYLRDAALFCLLGTTIKKAGSQEAFRKVDYDYPLQLARLAHEEGASSFLIVTAIGANAKSKIFYSRVKGELEEELRRIPLPRLHIFRPSLLLGKRDEFRLGEKIATVLAPLYRIFLFGKLKKYQPIHAKKIATSIVSKSKEDRNGVFIYESDEI